MTAAINVQEKNSIPAIEECKATKYKSKSHGKMAFKV